MRKIESKHSLIGRIERLDLNTADQRVAIENALRAERFADLLHELGTGLAKLVDAVVVKPFRRGAARFSRSAH